MKIVRTLKRVTALGALLLIGESLLAQELPMRELTLDETERIYGLSRFWSEAKRNFAFMEQAGGYARWDSLYRAFIPRVRDVADNLAYYRELERFCALLGDGHTNVYYPESWYRQMTSAQTAYFFRFKAFGEGVYVTGINERKAEEIPLGSELLAVDGRPVEEYLSAEIYPYLSTSASVKRAEALDRLLFAPVGTQRTICLRLPDGSEKVLTLRNDWFARAERILPEQSFLLTEHRKLRSGIHYLALNSFADPAVVDEFRKVLPEIRSANGLVIDLRNNGGGNSLYAAEIISELTTAPELHGAREYTVVYNPFYAAIAPYLKEHPELLQEDPVYGQIADAAARHFREELPSAHYRSKATDPIEIPVAVLCGGNTCSAAENFLIYIDPLDNFFTVGEPSFGSTGQPIEGELPGGGSYRICTKECTYPDGRKFIGVGVEPDIRIAPTIEDFLADRDPALDRAVEELIRRIADKNEQQKNR